MKYLRRLAYRSPGEPFNPLMHTFFFVSLALGICFAFLPALSGANITVLYTLTKLSLGTKVSSAWGIGLILVTAMNTVMLMFRPRWMGGTTAGLGFMLWLYAFIIYALGHFWIGVLAIALPNMWFWSWYYFKVKDYHRYPPSNVD